MAVPESHEASKPPVRAPRVCLCCRTLLLDGESCSCGMEAVAPASPTGWSALCDAAWGGSPPSTIRRFRRARSSALETLVSPATGVVVASMTVLTLFFSLFADDPAEALGKPGLWMVGILMSAFFGHCVRSGHDVRLDLAADIRPRGVPWPDAPRTRMAGTVDGEATLLSPFSGTPCSAWAVWIVSGDEVLLRDARCASMTILTDGGERIDIPAGRVEIAASMIELSSHPMKIADAFVVARRLHPPPVLGDDDPRQANHPFAGDVGFEIILTPGARVGIASAVTAEPTESPAHSYRDPLAKRMVPQGTAVLVTRAA
ncbi:MAG: hypothetical protein HOW73_26215 [Polyangiaceae bacterium]|nr:hypothetical protein [Polyangiaceae bacterium]